MQVLDAVHLPGCSMPACIHMIKFSRVMLGAGINYLQKAIQILASLDYLESFFKSMFKRTIETILKPLSLTETRLLNQRASHHDMTWPWTPEPTHPAPPHASQQSQNGSSCAPSKLWWGRPRHWVLRAGRRCWQISRTVTHGHLSHTRNSFRGGVQITKIT